MASKSRGSEKVLEQLFGDASATPQQLASAIERATTAGLKLERWWWKGQPRPDFFKAVTRIQPADFAATLTDLLKIHNGVNQISLELFPKGVPRLEAIDVHITVERNIGG